MISNPDRLLEIEDGWNRLVGKCSKNPFLFTGFVKQLMEFNRSKRWTPLVLFISADNKIVGLVPLKTKKKFGFRFVSFFSKSWLSPNFIVDEQYAEICIAHSVDFLFRSLQCQFVDLTLPAESPNLRIIKQECDAKGIHFCTIPTMGHRIIPVKCTWDEFKKSKGKKFRCEFRSIERKLDRAGSWRIVYVENGNSESDAFERILNVERMSWKEARRTQVGTKSDEALLVTWNGAQCTATTELDFKWRVWFLELSGQTVAYALVLQYKETAFIVKTSYNARYKRFYPGIYVNNAAIRELFNKRKVKTIDFLTDLPFERKWASLCLPRVRILMSRNSVLPLVIGFALSCKPVKGVLAPLSKRVSSLVDLFG